MTRINAGIPNQLTNNKNKVMKVQLGIKFDTKGDAGKWYNQDSNVITVNNRELLTEIEFAELDRVMRLLKDGYNVTDLHLHFDETEF